MGGDHGPAVVVEGAATAVREFGASVVLVGDRDAIEREIARLDVGKLDIEIRHASQVVGMAETPSVALRRKRDSSLRIAAELVRDGNASAFISAGNTGAAMAIAMFVIGVLRGIDRPAIAAVLPSLKRYTVLLDVGANVAPKPWHLFQYALMGHVYARGILGVDRPRVGLLSVGEEEGKGNDLTKEAYDQLKESSLNFVGNVEGRDIYNGSCDVVVTDGFTGNVALKTLEGGMRYIQGELLARLTSTPELSTLFEQIWPVLEPLVVELDPETYGGAMLLGVDGVCIISHGSSSARAIRNAVGVARDMVDNDLVGHLRTAVAGG
jgi:phosphate acyltransferase